MASDPPIAASANANTNTGSSQANQSSTSTAPPLSTSSNVEPSTIAANERATTGFGSSSNTAGVTPSRSGASPIQASASTASVTTASPAASTSSATATISMLPRSTATSSNNGAASSSSSSSSGTATPTNRASVSSLSTYAVSPRRASSSLAQHGQNPSFVPPPSSNRRIRQHNPTSSAPHPATVTALASIDGSTDLPSIFGFYSHDASATTQAASTRPNFLPTWRSSQSAQPRAGAWRASVHNDRRRFLHLESPPPESIRRGPGQSDWTPLSASSQLGSTLRPAQTRSNATNTSSINTSTDSSLFSASLPAPQPTFEETTTISFTWTINDLHLLREEVEHSPPPSEGGRSVSAGAGKSDVWTSHPTFGDGKWKLELVRTTRPLTVKSQQANGMDLHPSDSQDSSATATATAPTLEPVAVQDNDSSTNAPRDSITILSVYLTALVLDYTHANVEIPASIMVGLRPTRAAVGRRGSENGGWLWRRFYHYTFQKEADLFTCHDLPSVSEMLQDVNIARDDAVALTIQLGLGPGHSLGSSGALNDAASIRMPIEIDGHHLVPRAVLNSLRGLLDDANTGDVRILVRERGVLLIEASNNASMSDDGNVATGPEETSDRVVPYPVGSSCPVSSHDASTDALSPVEDDPDRVFVRDRVLWAHSSVLKSRSDYFATMLSSDFSEGIGRSYGAEASPGLAARNVRTLRIPDADFVTTYWFLRYLYTEDIQFADKEDVRSAVLNEEWAKGSDCGHLTSGSLGGDAGLQHPASNLLVDWTPISQLEDFDDFDMQDNNEAAHHSMSYSMTRAQPSSSSVEHGNFVPHVTASNATTSGSLRQRKSATGFGADISASIHASNRGSTLSPPASPLGAAATTCSATGGADKHRAPDGSSRVSGSGARRTLSNASTVAQPSRTGTHDPHQHPCSVPGPASALSIFKLAHRYHMQDLSRLASLHMVATLTPQSAFPMLLATSMYTELHTRIKTYVYQHWHLVSHTDEFERCCDEVSVGMWGADAGKTMRAFVKSLVSPLRALQV